MSAILFLLGAIIGSFLNVLALRFNSGLTLSGRSSCPYCGKKLGALELVPILSFFMLRGRCRECQARLSWQYPLVEAWTGAVFATVFNFQFSILQNVILLTVFSLFIAISVYDYRHKIVPDRLVYLAIVLSIVFRFFAGGETLDYLSGPIIALLFASIWLFSKGRAMGFGDAKLGLATGLLLGAATGFSGIVLAFWIGAGCGLLFIAFSKIRALSKGGNGLTIKSELPFAPFIVIGSWLALAYQLDLLNVAYF